MAQFAKPKFDYTSVVANEIRRLSDHKVTRRIPDCSAGNLLVATWNIANLGAHERRDQDFADFWHDGKNTKNFKSYLRYSISDHRPMWV